MQTTSRGYLRKETDFFQGLQSGLTIAIGYMPIALTFGLLAKTTGLTTTEATMMSVLVFAGAAQYISLSLLEVGTSYLVIVLTTFIVNIRHLLMSASLNERVEKDNSFKKALYAFGITDETFTVASMRKEKLTTAYLLGVNFISYISWVSFTVVGFLVGASLPDVIQESMGIALYAMFVGLLVPALKAHRKIVMLAGFAAVLNSILTFLLPSNFQGWAIVGATLTSAILVELVFERKQKNE